MTEPENSITVCSRAADIILSCFICQESLSSIHAKYSGIHGLHRSDDPTSGRITKLWLTECAHLICGKHFKGGGAPFHSVQQIPRAPCPLCTAEKNDGSEKALFFVNGTAKGEYDSNIPEHYFETPPLNLIDGNRVFEALRFQYLALLRYGLKMREKARQSDRALKQSKDNETEMARSLMNINPLKYELLRAGNLLTSLDMDVATIEEVLNLVGTSLFQSRHDQSGETIPEKDISIIKADEASQSSVDTGSRLAKGTAADLGAFDDRSTGFAYQDYPHLPYCDGQESTKKRKREVSTSGKDVATDRFIGNRKGASRHLMPPPPIPHRQPYVFMTRIPENDFTGPPPNYRETEDQATSESPDPPSCRQASIDLTPRYTFSNSRMVPRGHHEPDILTSGHPPRESAWPIYITQASNVQGESSQSPSPATASSQSSLQFLLEQDIRGPNDHDLVGQPETRGGPDLNGSTSSRHRRLSRPSMDNVVHRRLLGEESPTSRHPQSGRLSRSVPAYHAHSQSTMHTRRLAESSVFDIDAHSGLTSSVHTLGQSTAFRPSRHSNNTTAPSHSRNGPRRGGIISVGSSVTRAQRRSQSRGRPPTADPEASAVRRRANR